MQKKDIISQLEAKIAKLEGEKTEWKEKYNALATKTSAASRSFSNTFNPLMHSVQQLLNFRPERVKRLVSEGKIGMSDTDSRRRTLLVVASLLGNYDIAQLCINLGANIDHKDKWGRTAIDWATKRGRHYCEQLLRFSKLNANVSDNVQNIAFSMNKQNGIIENIINEMNNVINDKTEQSIFMDTLTKILCNIIDKKLSFSDDLLNLCWVYNSNGTNNTTSDLWKTLMNTCNNIIEHGNKKDWYYFKTFILTSNMWYRKRKDSKGMNNVSKDNEVDDSKSKDNETKSDENDSFFNIYPLLEMVESKSKEILANLDHDLKSLIDKNKHDWNKLVDWNMGNNDLIRQDNIVNGITSGYKEADLIYHTSSTFNSRKFCDFNDYLPKLVLLAHMVDETFHTSIENIFNINKENGIGYLTIEDQNDNTAAATPAATPATTPSIDTMSDETKTNELNDNDTVNTGNKNNTIIDIDNVIEYTRGPVKLYSRALSKSENDYRNESYPTSACVLDFNRCTLTFNNISTLLNALNLFVNKVNYYQSGNIIKIVRCKNTFKNYANKPDYADIKLNVIIKGNTNNIVGEVQFLLKPMLNFKKQAHNLYSIQRQEEFVKSSLTVILPQLLDKEKQLFVAANMGNVKKLCQVMVVNNLPESKILNGYKQTKQTILHPICRLGHVKAFKFVESLVTSDEWLNHLFAKNERGHNCIDESVTSAPIYKNFFSNKKIINVYKNDSNLICLLLCVMGKRQTNERLKEFIQLIGDEAFVKHACMRDSDNWTILEWAVRNSNVEMIKMLLSYKKILQQYKSNQYWLFRLLYRLFTRDHDSVVDFVFKKLELYAPGKSVANQFVLNTMFDYRYVPLMNKDVDNANKNGLSYAGITILAMIGILCYSNTLTKFISIVGTKAFIANVLVPDYENLTILEAAIDQQKMDIIQLVLSYDEIRQKIKQNKYWLYRILWQLFQGKHDSNSKNMIDFVINQLNLSQNDIIDLISTYVYKEDSNIINTLGEGAKPYGLYNIVTISQNHVNLELLCSIVGNEAFGTFVFIPDAYNVTALERAACSNKVEMIKFMLSFEYVKNIYQTSSYWTYRLYWLYVNGKIDKGDSLFKDILKDLDLSKSQTIKLLQNYQYKEEKNDNLTFHKEAVT